MKMPRSSIVTLMRVVGIVVLKLRPWDVSIYQFVPWRLAGIFLIGVVLQVGFLCLIGSRGRPRRYAFWAGLELGGLVGLSAFSYARVPDSWVGSLWEEYACTSMSSIAPTTVYRCWTGARRISYC